MLLLDQNISFRLARLIQNEFPNATHVSSVGLLGARDENIWKYAMINQLAILTFDSDFYDLALVRGVPPKIIWIRTGNLTTREIHQLLLINIKQIFDFLSEDVENSSICLELL